ncbi:hypothetical protein Tco_0676388 [Tanacetum coccineum]
MDLNAQLQEKVLAITSLKNELRKLKGKNVVNTVVSKPNGTIAPGMFKLDIEPISPRLKNNRDAHEVYIEKTIEYTDTLRGFVERARTQYPSEPLLESACMFTKHVQELLVYVSQTCPNSPKPCEKLVAVTPINKDKRVIFAEPVKSLNNIPKQTDSLKTKYSNKHLFTSTGVKPTTSASRSKPLGNTKNNRITRPPRSYQKNKVEDHLRKVKSSLNKTNSISEPISNVLVKHSVRNAKFEYICAICNKCLFDANHDMCLVDFVNDFMSADVNKENSYASLVRPNVATKVHFCTLVIEEKVDNFDCVLPKIAAAKVMRRYENSIVGFFVGKDPSFPVVQQYVSSTWRKFGFEKITRNDEGVYLFKFASKSGYGPSFGEGTVVDSSSFASALIEITSSVLPSFGHETNLCPKRVREELPKNSARDTKATAMEENDDGFIEVKSRKKKRESDRASPSVSTNDSGKGNGGSKQDLNTSNLFDVLNVEGDDMGDSGKQSKGSEQVNSDFNVNNKKDHEPSSSKSACNDFIKDKEC